MSITLDRQGIPTNRPLVVVKNQCAPFTILGDCRRAAMKAGWTTVQWARFRDLIIRENTYDGALFCARKHFDVWAVVR